MKKILLYLLAASFSLLAQGQKPFDNHIQVNNLSFEKRENGELTVKAAIVLDKKFKISTNRGATLTPVLRSGEYAKALPSVIVYGRKRAILSRRNQRIPADAYAVVRRNRNKEQVIDYRVSLPCQTWMPSSDFLLEADLCGCGNAVEENFEQLLATVPTFAPEKVEEIVAEVKPEPAPAPPVEKKYRKRVKEGDGQFHFPVNQVTIYPEYMGNPAELKKVQALIEDDDIKYISHITVHAYASPEGSLPNNVRLAQGRAASLKQLLMERYQFSDSIFTVKSTPEDWDGFRQLVVASDLPDKAAVLAIIDNNKGLDEKERQLKMLGKTYTYILREWFPRLRHLSYTVEYMIPEEEEPTE